MKRVPLASPLDGRRHLGCVAGVCGCRGQREADDARVLTNAALTPQKCRRDDRHVGGDVARGAPDAQRIGHNYELEMIAACALAIDQQFLATATAGISVATVIPARRARLSAPTWLATCLERSPPARNRSCFLRRPARSPKTCARWAR